MEAIDQTVGVITGDVVSSSRIGERELLITELRSVFKEARSICGNSIDFEIYRGDSFQGVTGNSWHTLRIALLIRSKLLMQEKRRRWDARIAIGLGQAQYVAKTIVESDGEAFVKSGRLLEEMEKEKRRLDIDTPWERVNNELKIHARVIDTIVSEWSTKDAEIAYYYLLEDQTQQQVADKLNISQPAARKRLHHAMLPVIKLMIGRFEELTYLMIADGSL